MSLKTAKTALLAYERPANDPLAQCCGTKPTFIERDGEFLLSAEDGRCFADYYMQYDLHAFSNGIDPRLVAIAKEHGCFFEWMNPGAAALYAN